MSKPYTVYLAGPMTKYKDEGWNLQAFKDATSRLREYGVVVLSPAETAGGEGYAVGSMPRTWYMQQDFRKIDAADAVVVLPEWQDSPGARKEVVYADATGKDVFEYSPPPSAKPIGSKITRITMDVEYSVKTRYGTEEIGTGS